MKRFYLDENATTRIDPGIAAYMTGLGADILGNPSSLHAEGRRARGEVDNARDTVATWLGAKPSEIIFTSGGTESCNLAVLGLARAHRSRGQHLITAATEHHAVLHAFQALEKRDGFSVTYLRVDREGRVDPADLESAIRPETTLVSIMSANNETGVRQPMCELGAICARRGVLFPHRCGAERRARKPIDRAGWQVSFRLEHCTAHKFHGPLGAGAALAAGRTCRLIPLMEGGAHENERRPGHGEHRRHRRASPPRSGTLRCDRSARSPAPIAVDERLVARAGKTGRRPAKRPFDGASCQHAQRHVSRPAS